MGGDWGTGTSARTEPWVSFSVHNTFPPVQVRTRSEHPERLRSPLVGCCVKYSLSEFCVESQFGYSAESSLRVFLRAFTSYIPWSLRISRRVSTLGIPKSLHLEYSIDPSRYVFPRSADSSTGQNSHPGRWGDIRCIRRYRASVPECGVRGEHGDDRGGQKPRRTSWVQYETQGRTNGQLKLLERGAEMPLNFPGK